jgi:hypothetical protein
MSEVLKVRDFYVQLVDELAHTASVLNEPAQDVLLGLATALKATIKAMDKRAGVPDEVSDVGGERSPEEPE